MPGLAVEQVSRLMDCAAEGVETPGLAVEQVSRPMGQVAARAPGRARFAPLEAEAARAAPGTAGALLEQGARAQVPGEAVARLGAESCPSSTWGRSSNFPAQDTAAPDDARQSPAVPRPHQPRARTSDQAPGAD